MKELLPIPLLLGIFGTFAFSWAGLTFIPNYQIGHLDPQMDEEGTDAYPRNAIRDGRARPKGLCGKRLRLLPQPAGACGLRRIGHRTQMGESPQRAARLHF